MGGSLNQCPIKTCGRGVMVAYGIVAPRVSVQIGAITPSIEDINDKVKFNK